MDKKKSRFAAERSDKRAEIIIVRHYGDKDFIQLYAQYAADKILNSIKEEQSA